MTHNKIKQRTLQSVDSAALNEVTYKKKDKKYEKRKKMSSIAIQIWPEQQRSLDFSSISASYMGIGTFLENPSVLFEMYNFTDVPLQISLDGVTDHFPLQVGASIRDFSSNKGKGDSLSLPSGTRVYVRQLTGAPTTGAIYVASWYRNIG